MSVCVHFSRTIGIQKSIKLLSLNATCFVCVCSCFENNKKLYKNNAIDIFCSHIFSIKRTVVFSLAEFCSFMVFAILYFIMESISIIAWVLKSLLWFFNSFTYTFSMLLLCVFYMSVVTFDTMADTKINQT